jgi:hypothetical protein
MWLVPFLELPKAHAGFLFSATVDVQLAPSQRMNTPLKSSRKLIQHVQQAFNSAALKPPLIA